ncbi:MAG TPA: DoxX family protein [Ramlibacter sp.]|nr:DoxX family protein [Ramlibacter sp.]
MMTPSTSMQDTWSLMGRALIALVFVPEGVQKITGFGQTVNYIVAAGVPLPEVAAAASIVVEVGLGLLLLAGFQTRWVALGIAIYTLVVTFIFHPFWAVPAAEAMMQRINFFKNLGLVGGLLTIMAWGAGGWSVDGRDHALEH